MNDIEILQGLRNAHINDTYKGKKLSLVLTNAIEALQEKAEHDNSQPLPPEQLKERIEYEKLEKEELLLRLPMPLGTILYEVHTTCGDFCTFDKELFAKTIRKKVGFDGCCKDEPCHTRILPPNSLIFTLTNFNYVVRYLGTRIFKTIEEAQFATKKIVMQNRAEMAMLGFEFDETGYAITEK